MLFVYLFVCSFVAVVVVCAMPLSSLAETMYQLLRFLISLGFGFLVSVKSLLQGYESADYLEVCIQDGRF